MPRKKTKVTKEDMLECIFHPKENIAFLDAEFNAGMDYASGEKISEIISIGFVICDNRFNGQKKFYTLVSPLSQVPVFPMISRMTGITTDMLEGQPSFAQMSESVTELMHKYHVGKVYTWGAADKHSLLAEKTSYRKKRKNGYQQASRWDYIDLCEDISGVISNEMLGIRGGLAINMENLMFVCGIHEKQEHNALSDALQLFQCVKHLSTHYPLSKKDDEFMEKRELINRYYQEKSVYNSFRRFRCTSKGCDLYKKWNKESYKNDIRIKALEDDIRFLKGEIPYETEFDTIQEYFAKHQSD